MPEVNVICIKDWIMQIESQLIEYDIDETLESVLNKFDEKFDKLNSDVQIGSDFIQDYKLPVTLLMAYGDRIVIHQKEKRKDTDMRIYVELFDGSKIPIDCNSSWKLDDFEPIMKKLVRVSIKNYIFIFGGRRLWYNDTLLVQGVINESTILMVPMMRGGGGGPEFYNFVDVSSKKGPQKIKFSKRAPDWRIVSTGLCLEGLCMNLNCRAYFEHVIMNMGTNICYDIGLPDDKTKCPVCSKYVQPLTCAFNNCKFRYVGIKITSNGLERVKGDWIECDDNYYRFDRKEHGIANWSRLVLECKDDDNKISHPTVECDQITILKANLIISNYKL